MDPNNKPSQQLNFKHLNLLMCINTQKHNVQHMDNFEELFNKLLNIFHYKRIGRICNKK